MFNLSRNHFYPYDGHLGNDMVICETSDIKIVQSASQRCVWTACVCNHTPALEEGWLAERQHWWVSLADITSVFKVRELVNHH